MKIGKIAKFPPFASPALPPPPISLSLVSKLPLMPEQKFKRGDVVVLMSGGPDMTVDKYEQSIDLVGTFTGRAKPLETQQTEYVECLWFDNTEKKKGTFHQDVLRKKQG